MLTPEYTASATLTGIADGKLLIEQTNDSLVASLIPFMRGEKGDKGDDGNYASDYVHTQVDASASWMVAHNQNRYPQVTVLNHLNARIEPDVSYVDENIVLIEHAKPTVGKAILS